MPECKTIAAIINLPFFDPSLSLLLTFILFIHHSILHRYTTLWNHIHIFFPSCFCILPIEPIYGHGVPAMVMHPKHVGLDTILTQMLLSCLKYKDLANLILSHFHRHVIPDEIPRIWVCTARQPLSYNV